MCHGVINNRGRRRERRKGISGGATAQCWGKGRQGSPGLGKQRLCEKPGGRTLRSARSDNQQEEQAHDRVAPNVTRRDMRVPGSWDAAAVWRGTLMDRRMLYGGSAQQGRPSWGFAIFVTRSWSALHAGEACRSNTRRTGQAVNGGPWPITTLLF